jgi:hypothetical protein
MKRILYTHTNFIPYFVVGKGIAMFSYLTLGTNGAMFTYLTQGTNRVLSPKYYNTKGTYNKEMGIIYINFIKALLHNRLNLDSNKFKKREEIINYLEEFQGDKLFSKTQISRFKTQGEFERVPLTPKSKEFINYVKREFPDFDGFEFALVKPITTKESKDIKLVNEAPHTIVQNKETVTKNKTKPKLIEPTIIETIPTSTTVSGTSKETVTETIAKYVEPVVTQTIVKAIEPVAKVVDPVVKVVETVANIPNIIINNANNANAEATTITSNTQHASSGLDNLLNLFGLKSIAKILKDIFGFDGDGIIFFLIQLPYLVWWLLAFKDHPELMEYLNENFGIEEYKAPNPELAPIEYDFAPMDFYYDDSNTIDTAYEADFIEDAARNYTNNSDVEYFDYFDYYHSKPDTISDNESTPTAKEVVKDFKDMGNSLLESTKDKVNNVVATIAELEPVKNKPEIHVIDDQFLTSYGTIDVFTVAQEVQNMKISSSNNRSSIGGFFKWLFPMLDFYNLNYHPSYFEKFNLNTKVQPITNKVDYVKLLINELYYTLNLGKFEVPKVNFNLNLPEFGKVTPSGNRIQSHADTLNALEGINPKRKPNWGGDGSLISDDTSFSTYFNRDWNRSRIGRLPSVNSSPIDILLGNRTSVGEIASRSIPNTPSLVIDTKNNVDNSWIYDSPLPSVNSTPIRPLYYSDYYPLEAINAEETTNALATKQDTKIGVHDWLNVKKAINEVDAEINQIKFQLVDFHHKITSFTNQMTELAKQKIHYTEKSNNGSLSFLDKNALKRVLNQLEYINGAKAKIEGSMDAENLNDKLNSLEIRKTSLLELKNKYEKELGNIATTPNV